jgi:hypothetical protein
MKSRIILSFPRANIIKLICVDFHWHIPFWSPKIDNIIQCKIYLSRPGIIDTRARSRAAARRLRNTGLKYSLYISKLCFQCTYVHGYGTSKLWNHIACKPVTKTVVLYTDPTVQYCTRLLRQESAKKIMRYIIMEIFRINILISED